MLTTLVATTLSLTTPQDDTEARIDFIRENAVVMRSIDPDDEDFSDLMPLIDLIGDARIVGLGEQTHGDGATFHAKGRLVRFLHQHMGFDVLVWESGMYDCHLVDLALQNGVPASEAVPQGVFPIWTASQQVAPTIEYIGRTQASPSRLEIAGMDSQMTGQATPAAIAAHLATVAGRTPIAPGLQEAIDTVSTDLVGLTNREPITAPTHDAFQDAAKRVATAFEQATEPWDAVVSPRERSLLARTLRNAAAMQTQMYHMMRQDGEMNMMRGALAREKGMADTMIWLARDRYPDRKLIVWAASSHIMHGSRSVEMIQADGSYAYDTEPWTPMGNAVRDALGDEVYTIGFIAHHGNVGSVFRHGYALPAPPTGSLDDLCEQTGHPYLFVDLRDLPDEPGGAFLRERLVARPRGYANMRTDWSGVCDAMVFTSEMYKSDRLEPPVAGGD